MKKADVKVGGTYLCYVGAELAEVVVTGVGRVGWSDRQGFIVTRKGESKALPKTRSAAALREV